MLAYSYPLLSVFWTLLMFAGFVLSIFIVIWAFIDNSRRPTTADGPRRCGSSSSSSSRSSASWPTSSRGRGTSM